MPTISIARTPKQTRPVVPVSRQSDTRRSLTKEPSRQTHKAPIKTRRRCIVYILESLAGGKPMSMVELQHALLRSTSQVRRLLTTIRRQYTIRIILRGGRYHLDPRYNPDEVLSVAYKILRGNDHSVFEAMFLMNRSRLSDSVTSLVGLRYISDN